MTIKDVIRHLEHKAPPVYQEAYDNSGLIVGNAALDCSGALVCLDSTEAVIDEAIKLGYNLVIAHHPIVFKGLKRLTGKSYIERVLIKAIKHDIAIYAIHTNLDNVRKGVNKMICKKIGVVHRSVLKPKASIMRELKLLCPAEQVDVLRNALVKAGAGFSPSKQVLDFNALGVTHHAEDGTAMAQLEMRMLYPISKEQQVLKALKKTHPSKHPHFTIQEVLNTTHKIGSGMIGSLKEPMSALKFLKHLKKQMGAKCIRHTALLGKPIKKVAVCGGSGGFLLRDAIAQGADIFITADYKYHEFFDADGRIIIADIGHYESEQYTIELISEILSKKFDNFAVSKTKQITNPVHYL